MKCQIGYISFSPGTAESLMYKVSQRICLGLQGLQHQSRGRALILMTQTQHPCCSCSLTPFYTHTHCYIYVYTAFWIPHSHSLIYPPSSISHTLSHTFFPSLPPLPSLLSSSPVTTPSVMIHIMNHRHIFEGFSPRLPLSLSLSSPLYPSHFLSLFLLPLVLLMLSCLALFSKFQTVASRICLCSTSQRVMC